MSDKVINDVQGQATDFQVQANNQGLTLYGYWRSSAAYRVRIALNLKGMDYQYVPVHLVKDGGQQHSEGYHQLNPSELVPTLVHNGFVLNQSMAIIDYLESLNTDVPLLPELEELQLAEHQSKELRWLVQSIAQDISVDIHPLNNLRVLQYLKGELGCTEDQAKKWYQHWIMTGFHSIEEKLEKLDNIHIKHKLSIKHDHRIKHGQPQSDNNLEGKVAAYALGEQPSLIDVCLIPQVYNALRFDVDMSAYPKIMSIYEYANTQPAFISALPENQSDAT